MNKRYKIMKGIVLDDELKLSERSRIIISIVEKNPGFTIDEIASVLYLSKPTTERAIAVLKAKQIMLRIGSKKTGTWEINKSKIENKGGSVK
jgi:ATP-dependent DNA helicase RecG